MLFIINDNNNGDCNKKKMIVVKGTATIMIMTIKGKQNDFVQILLPLLSFK